MGVDSAPISVRGEEIYGVSGEAIGVCFGVARETFGQLCEAVRRKAA